jgi:hypothetical protein
MINITLQRPLRRANARFSRKLNLEILHPKCARALLSRCKHETFQAFHHWSDAELHLIVFRCFFWHLQSLGHTIFLVDCARMFSFNSAWRLVFSDALHPDCTRRAQRQMVDVGANTPWRPSRNDAAKGERGSAGTATSCRGRLPSKRTPKPGRGMRRARAGEPQRIGMTDEACVVVSAKIWEALHPSTLGSWLVDNAPAADELERPARRSHRADPFESNGSLSS